MDDVAVLNAEPKSAASWPVTTVLSIIIPTLNERENIEPLLALVTAALPHSEWEVIFVDDDFARRHGRARPRPRAA